MGRIRRAGLALHYLDSADRPVEVVESQHSNVSQSHSKARRKQEYREVRPTFGRTTIYNVEEFGDQFLVPHRRNRGMARDPDRRSCATEVPRQDFA